MSDEEIKQKRKRYKKPKEKIAFFKCSECEKSYLSIQALYSHKKNKHFPQNKKEIRKKGRPKKNSSEFQKKYKETLLYLRKYNSFFNDKKRKKTENIYINLNLIEEQLINIFKKYKIKLFFTIENIQNYSFYKLIINNWDKENPDLEKESLNGIHELNEIPKKIKKTNLDGIFFIYLKEVSKITNINYFYFILEFIIIFREYINELRNNYIYKEIQTENKKYYTEIYNAESVPNICNDFFNIFLEKYNFTLDENELMEIIQHFCYWLYKNHFSSNHLTIN